MVTAGSTHDVRLTTASGGTDTGLMLALDELGQKIYVARKVPPIPDEPLKIRQTSWHRGFGQVLYRSDDPHRYAYSNGVDLRIPNGAQLIPNLSEPVGFGVRNSSCQLAATTYWTAGTGVTLSAQTAALRTGANGFRMVTDGSRSSGDPLMEQALPNGEVYDSRTIRIACYAKRTAGSESGVTLEILTLGSTTSGPSAGGTAADDSTVGTQVWTNVNNVLTDDATKSVAILAIGEDSDYLKVTNFGFSVSGTITGVEIRVTRAAAAGQVMVDNSVRIFDGVGSAYVGDNKADTGTNWSESSETVVYGGPTDDWGASLDSTDVNNSGFGVGISGNCVNGGARGAKIFFVSIKIYTGGSETSQDTKITTSSSFALLLSDAIAIPGSTTGIIVRLKTSAGETGTHTYEVDDFVVIPAGDRTPMAVAIFDDRCFLSTGRLISYYEAASQAFLPAVLDNDEEFKALAVHGGYIYGSHNAGYTYSNDTSDPPTTWTDVTPTTGAADFIVSTMDHLGVQRLYRADLPNTIYVSNETYGNAIGAGDWAAETYTVGEKDKNITRLHKAFDTILVGREDGLFYFYAPDNTFRSATEMFELVADAENFDRGSMYVDSRFYTVSARYGLLAVGVNGGEFSFAEGAPALAAPTYDDFGGRVRALVHDGYWLYAVQDRPVADETAAKTVNLMAAAPDGVWHSLVAIDMGVPEAALICSNDLILAGRLYNSDMAGTLTSDEAFLPAVFTMALPTKHRNMMKEASIDVEDAGTKTFVTSIIDFAEEGYGSDDKGWLKILVEGAGTINANLTITVEEQIDGDISDTGAWTAVGAAITSLTNGEATVSFTASTSTGKRGRFRFTMATNINTDGPVLRAFTVFVNPHPDRRWRWQFTAALRTDQVGLGGQFVGDTSKTLSAALDTLAAEDFPLKFYDVDGTAYDAEIVDLEKVVLARQDSQGRVDPEHIDYGVRLSLAEKKTS